MSRSRQRDSKYRPSPLSRQLSSTSFPDTAIAGQEFDPQPNVCVCSPQACSIATGDMVDHNSIYIHYLAMMQSFGISGPTELQSILAGDGGKPELTVQLKTSLSHWSHLGWLKANTTTSGDGDTLGQEPLIASGSSPDEPTTDTGTRLNDSPQHAERRASSETESDDESDGGVLVRQPRGSPYYEGESYGPYRGGHRGFAMDAEDFDDFEDTHGVDYSWYTRQFGGRG